MHSALSNADFLSKLQAEAALQAQLHRHRVLPTQLDWLTSLIGRYSWQTLSLLAVVTAVAMEVL